MTGDGTCSIVPGTPSDADADAGAITCQPGTLQATNYSPTSGRPGTLTITKAAQTIKFTSTAKNHTYGDSYTPDRLRRSVW